MNKIDASVITIGDELLIGQTIDTNSSFIGQELNKLGIWLKRRVAIGDDKQEILNALKNQSNDCQIIIITGGLGPTGDDITKSVLCEYFNSTLIINERALENVKNIFKRLNRPLIERNLRQAEVPDNCIVLHNLRGTAPGMWFEQAGVIYISLPGVPNEMKGLLLDSVLPLIKEKMNLPYLLHKTLLLAGKGESEIAEIIFEFEKNLPTEIKLAYLPSYGLLRLRLTGRSENEKWLFSNLEFYFKQLQNLLTDFIVANEDIPIEEVVNRLFRQLKITMSTAESCTGGYIAHLITSRPGSSDLFKGGIISYSNEIKMKSLGVKEETLKKYGAVSEQTVIEMVRGINHEMKTDYGIAVSGIMGPTGGSTEKPVGTLWIATGNKKTLKTNKYHLRFDRERNIEQAAILALIQLRKFVLEQEVK